MREIKIIIEGRPFTVNKQYCTRKGSRKLRLSEEALDNGNSIGWQAKIQYMHYSRKPLTQDLEVIYLYYFPDVKKKIDHLNYNKLLNDRMSQIVYMDDRQIKISHHYTLFDEHRPRTEIIIKIINYEERIKEFFKPKAEGEAKAMPQVQNLEPVPVVPSLRSDD